MEDMSTNGYSMASPVQEAAPTFALAAPVATNTQSLIQSIIAKNKAAKAPAALSLPVALPVAAPV